MKLIDVDKVREWATKNTSWLYAAKDYLNDIPQLDKKKLLSFIDANSVEADIIIPQGIVEINDKIMEREYDNYLDAIYLVKKKEVL